MDTKILDLDQIVPDPSQPRRAFKEEALNELAESIRAIGVTSPIHVRQLDDPDRYVIIAGERRWRASAIAGQKDIPCIILSYNTDALVFQIVENVQREALNPIEEALGYRRLIDEKSLSQAEIVELVGKSDFHVSTRLSLLSLPDEIKTAIADAKLSVACGTVLVKRCGTHQEMLEAMGELKKKLATQAKGLSGITAASLTSYFDKRDRKRLAVERLPTMRISPEEKVLADEILSCQGAFIEAFTRMVGVAESPESADYCVRLWLSLSEQKQRLFARGLQMIQDHTKTLMNHLKGGKNRVARRTAKDL